VKTKELIAMLQEEDPSGEANVMTSDGPVYFCELKPGWYDGAGYELIIDENKKPYYSVIGMRRDTSTDKICIQGLDIRDILFDARPEERMNKLIWEYKGANPKGLEDFLAYIKEVKEKVLKEITDIEIELKNLDTK
jgi:hypothetical protein